MSNNLREEVMKRTVSLIGLLTVLVGFTLGVPITACQHSPQSKCTDLGVEEGDRSSVSDSNILTLVVLVDLPNNELETIERVTKQITQTIYENLGDEDQFSLIGGVYTGQSNNVSRVACMDGISRSFAYVPGKNNDTKMKRERQQYLNEVEEQMKSTLSTAAAPHDEVNTGDFRNLINWAKNQLGNTPSSNSRVILWSNFLSNGSDCLNISTPASASAALAEEIVQRCQNAELIPSLGNTEFQIIGSGYAMNAALSSFSSQLAAAFCPRISTNCRV